MHLGALIKSVTQKHLTIHRQNEMVSGTKLYKTPNKAKQDPNQTDSPTKAVWPGSGLFILGIPGIFTVHGVILGVHYNTRIPEFTVIHFFFLFLFHKPLQQMTSHRDLIRKNYYNCGIQLSKKKKNKNTPMRWRVNLI